MMTGTFSDVIDAIHSTHSAYRARNINLVVSPSEDMLHTGFADYVLVGTNAIENIFSAMLACSKSTLNSILDIPCGFGRVTRHLAAAFPHAELYVCDLYQDRIDFCAQAFAATPIKSKSQFDQISLAANFDLIWCGSLLTHVPETPFKDALQLFSQSLNPGGIAVVTTHGRYASFAQHNRWKYLPDEQFAKVEEAFSTSGFGYGDYHAPDRSGEQQSYGISLSSPSYVAALLAKDDSIRMRGFIERGWHEHQDVVVFQKIPINS
jgi:SAM-dependent methyltransferase